MNPDRSNDAAVSFAADRIRSRSLRQFCIELDALGADEVRSRVRSHLWPSTAAELTVALQWLQERDRSDVAQRLALIQQHELKASELTLQVEKWQRSTVSTLLLALAIGAVLLPDVRAIPIATLVRAVL